ncbi:hypothetical protein DFH06DRAFT_1414730 [Mycena polygramma]|nr:hypothetical protein DFH06DRAFT_1414730 [Mycena polygramma]
MSWDKLEWPDDEVLRFFERLPVLEELQLDTFNPFSHLPFPWSQLRRCTLKRCLPIDMLRILPLLSPGAQFCITGLSSLVAPALKELALSTHKDSSGNLDSPGTLASPTIISFLSRSACALTSLCLSLPLRAEDFIHILDSPHTRSVVHLDISNKMSTQWMEALTSRGLVPHLHTLGFRADRTLTEAPVLTMVANRRPALRELRIASPRLHPVLSQAAVQALGADGMEVFLSEYKM